MQATFVLLHVTKLVVVVAQIDEEVAKTGEQMAIVAALVAAKTLYDEVDPLNDYRSEFQLLASFSGYHEDISAQFPGFSPLTGDLEEG